MADTTTTAERYERGRELLDLVDGAPGDEVVDAMGELGIQIVEFMFGDIYSRPGLSLRDRELITVAMLAAMRGCEPQLEIHIGSAMNVGVTPDELRELIMHVGPYAGFPAAVNAMKALQKVEAERVTVAGSNSKGSNGKR